MMAILAGVTAVLAGIGLVEALVVSRLVAVFARRPTVPPRSAAGHGAEATARR